MKIVILDGYRLNPGDLNWNELEKLGEVVNYDRTTEDQIVERIGDADVILTNKTPITDATMKACKNLKYVGVLATGYNVVDVEAAKENGVRVTNIPTYGTKSVAQFAMALLLELCHRIGDHSNEVKKGRWATGADWCFWDHPLIELDQKKIGVIGFGRIGRTTAMLAQAFGLEVLAYDHYEIKNLPEGMTQLSLEEVLKQSDFITLHCPLFESTKNIISKENIELMKDGVKIINTSRGGLVNEDDLYEALKSGKVSGAGLDVLNQEPCSSDNPLLTLNNCIVTPHIAWAPVEARGRLLDVAVNNVKSFIDGKEDNKIV